MNTLFDKVIDLTDKIVNRSGKLGTLVDVVLDRIAPQATAKAQYCYDSIRACGACVFGVKTCQKWYCCCSNPPYPCQNPLCGYIENINVSC